MKTRNSLLWMCGAAVAAGLFFRASAQEVPLATPVAVTGTESNAAQQEVYLSGWFGEVVKLAQAGLDQSVLLTYIATTPGTFNLGADQIIYLRDIGVGDDVISAMLQHDQELAAGVREAPAAAPPSTLPSAHELVQRWFGSAAVTQTSSKGASAPVANATPGEHPTPVAAAEPEPTPAAAQASEPEPGYAPAAALVCHYQPPQQQQELYPVRKPYAEQLTDTIVVYRAQGRVPNTMILEMFP